jgi:hypothetical protein
MLTQVGVVGPIDLMGFFLSSMPHCAPDSMPEYNFELIIQRASDTMSRPKLLCAWVRLEHTGSTIALDGTNGSFFRRGLHGARRARGHRARR